MTGKCYYMTTLAAWRRHAGRFTNSHYVVLSDLDPSSDRYREGHVGGEADDVRILVLVEADEGVHLALEDEPAFEALPHPLAQKPISDAAQTALAAHGVKPGATTFEAAEATARTHPLLRHRVF